MRSGYNPFTAHIFFEKVTVNEKIPITLLSRFNNMFKTGLLCSIGVLNVLLC